MAREGTRSATGNSKPRVFDTPDTAPAITRKPRAKTTTKPAGSKPVGVTKTKKTGPAKKARCLNPALLPNGLLDHEEDTLADDGSQGGGLCRLFPLSCPQLTTSIVQVKAAVKKVEAKVKKATTKKPKAKTAAK